MAPSSPSDSSHWFLEVNGKKFGPYTIAQVQALLRHKEILPEDKIYPAEPALSAHVTTVGEFIQRISQSVGAHIPPRPAALDPVPTSPTEPEVVHDLFDILQSAKERKPKASPAISAVPEMQAASGPSGGMPVKAIVGVFALIIVGGVYWVASSSVDPSKTTSPSAPMPTHEKPKSFHSDPVRPAAHAPAPASTATTVRARPATPAATVTHKSTPVAAPRKIPAHELPRGYTATPGFADDRERDQERERELADVHRGEDDRDADRNYNEDRGAEIEREYRPGDAANDWNQPRIPENELPIQPAMAPQGGAPASDDFPPGEPVGP